MPREIAICPPRPLSSPPHPLSRGKSQAFRDTKFAANSPHPAFRRETLILLIAPLLQRSSPDSPPPLSAILLRFSRLALDRQFSSPYFLSSVDTRKHPSNMCYPRFAANSPLILFHSLRPLASATASTHDLPFHLPCASRKFSSE